MAAYDDLDVRKIFIVGIGSVVVTAVTALAVQVLYYSLAEWQNAETQANSDYRRQNAILAEQTEQISAYGVDTETGFITIPIDEAIKLVVEEKSGDDNSSEKKSGSDET
ncbi:MAG: hypothetical protein ACR2NZ_24165 [Rubripirellula sp.]